MPRKHANTTEASVQNKRNDTLRRSDVMLSWGDFDDRAVAACRAYGVTAWGWGPSAQYLKSDAEVARQVREGHALGMRLIMGMVCETIKPPPSAGCYQEFLDDPALNRSECRDVAGKSIAPGWWDIDYKNGDRSYWNCANNPAFQRFFKDKAARAIKAGANGLFIDGILSNRQLVDLGGCFCEHCMAGFRLYLAKRYSRDELIRLGITDISTFNYRDVVAKIASNLEDHKAALKNGVDIPLLEDFRVFQMEYDVAFIKEVIQAAREAGGPGIPAAGNVCMLFPEWLICGDFLDFFVVELNHWGEPGHMPVLQHKIAAALGKPIASTPIGPSVQMIRNQELHGLLQIWISLSYSLGGNLMIPHSMWAEAHEDGSMVWYDAPRDKAVPLYHMVKEHADLFDGYDDVHQVAVLYSNRARRRKSRAVNQACFDLLNASIPFTLELAQDEYVPRWATTSREALLKHDLVLIPEATLAESHLTDEEEEIVSDLLAQKKAVFLNNGTDLRALVTPLTSLARGEGVWIVPRKKPGDAGAPLVIHIVNHDYDSATDTLRTKSDLVLRMTARLLAHKAVKAVIAIQPGREPVSVPVERQASGDVLVSLPEGNLWWVLKVDLD